MPKLTPASVAKEGRHGGELVKEMENTDDVVNLSLYETWEGGAGRPPLEHAGGSYACTGTVTLWKVELTTSYVCTLGVPSITFAKVFNTSGYVLVL